jgi:hypothetical protein
VHVCEEHELLELVSKGHQIPFLEILGSRSKIFFSLYFLLLMGLLGGA